jgi:hypothetical protein
MAAKKSSSKSSALLPLRHALATLAYRGGKAIKDAPPEFAGFRAGASSRTPLEILAHIGDLFDWAVCLADGAHVWKPANPASWEEQVERFFTALERFDQRLASSKKLECSPEKLFQGPIADALTHVGQINMLRRMAGSAVRGENYFKAEITAGKVGRAQARPRVEFD